MRFAIHCAHIACAGLLMHTKIPVDVAGFFRVLSFIKFTIETHQINVEHFY